MNKLPTLSVVTCCSEAISKEFYLKELIESVWKIADEIIIIDGDIKRNKLTSETHSIIIQSICKCTGDTCAGSIPDDFGNIIYENKLRIYRNPWQKRMGCMMGRLQRSLAISHATKDYIMLLDADEIIHEKDHDKIRECLKLGHIAYAWHTLHFYKDYNTIKIPGTGSGYYDYRANLFKNNSYIFDMHDSYSGYQGTVCATMADEERDRRYLPLINHGDCKKTSIEVFHYGHVRSDKVYLQKTNEINASYHPHYKYKTELMLDLTNIKKFEGTYPKVMKERIERFNNEFI